MALVLMFVTSPDEETASKLAEGALEVKLAACILRAPVESLYNWQGEKCQEGEILTLFKTSIENADSLEEWIAENHPYETPAIIRLGARANDSYEKWLAETLEA